MTKRILIYDPEISGHHTEYIEHLVNYLSKNNIDGEYFFVVNPQFSERFEYITEITKNRENLKWIFLQQEEYDNIRKGNLLICSFKNYFLLKKYAKKLKTNKILLMYFNIFQIMFCFLTPKFEVSAILFSQFFRQPKNSLKQKIRYYRKYCTTKMYAKNKSIRNIFILNDVKTPQFFNNEFNTHIFKMLPDPIPKLKPLDNFNICDRYKINKEKKIFLHIGTLCSRKGTIEILDSIEFIERDKQEKICFIFAGKSEANFRQKLKEKIEYFRKKYLIQIIWIDEFISKELMKTLFDQCDCVLLPYKMPEASSGVLGHAIDAGKVVIGTGMGLLGELIVENNLGYVIKNVHELGEKIMLVVKNKTIFSNIDFIKERSVEYFSKILMNNTSD